MRRDGVVCLQHEANRRLHYLSELQVLARDQSQKYEIKMGKLKLCDGVTVTAVHAQHHAMPELVQEQHTQIPVSCDLQL